MLGKERKEGKKGEGREDRRETNQNLECKCQACRKHIML